MTAAKTLIARIKQEGKREGDTGRQAQGKTRSLDPASYPKIQRRYRSKQEKDSGDTGSGQTRPGPWIDPQERIHRGESALLDV